VLGQYRKPLEKEVDDGREERKGKERQKTHRLLQLSLVLPIPSSASCSERGYGDDGKSVLDQLDGCHLRLEGRKKKLPGLGPSCGLSEGCRGHSPDLSR
jgi:hypothetical protein